MNFYLPILFLLANSTTIGYELQLIIAHPIPHTAINSKNTIVISLRNEHIIAATIINPRPVKIMDTTLRDAHQSLLATRMTTEEVLMSLSELDKAGYYCPDFRQKYVYKKDDKLKNKPIKLMNVIQHELKENPEEFNKLKKQFDERLSTSRK